VAWEWAQHLADDWEKIQTATAEERKQLRRPGLAGHASPYADKRAVIGPKRQPSSQRSQPGAQPEPLLDGLRVVRPRWVVSQVFRLRLLCGGAHATGKPQFKAVIR
jgi:hypothetical protein